MIVVFSRYRLLLPLFTYIALALRRIQKSSLGEPNTETFMGAVDKRNNHQVIVQLRWGPWGHSDLIFFNWKISLKCKITKTTHVW